LIRGRKKEIMFILAIRAKKGTKLGGCSRGRRRKSKIKWSCLKVNLQTRDLERGNKKR